MLNPLQYSVLFCLYYFCEGSIKVSGYADGIRIKNCLAREFVIV